MMSWLQYVLEIKSGYGSLIYMLVESGKRVDILVEGDEAVSIFVRGDVEAGQLFLGDVFGDLADLARIHVVVRVEVEGNKVLLMTGPLSINLCLLLLWLLTVSALSLSNWRNSDKRYGKKLD